MAAHGNRRSGRVPDIPSPPAVGQNTVRHCGQVEGIVEFAIGEETGVRGDARAVELQFQSAVKTGPKWAVIRFTLQVI